MDGAGVTQTLQDEGHEAEAGQIGREATTRLQREREGTPHGQPVACYLPIAGFDISTATAYGYYWSTTENGSSSAYCWRLNSGSALIGDNDSKTNGYSVRCVRSVAQGEVAQAPRASHAWVRASTGEEDGWSWINLRRAGRRT